MKRCGYCSKENPDSAIYCVRCGEPLDDFDTSETVDAVIDDTPKQQNGPEDASSVRCPSCGSSDIHFVTTETGSDFKGDSACCGFLLFGPIGLLCGLAGDRQSRTVRKCMNCGHEF
jgi:DNA-directed RNA polymerase subunit M/transcription elongation factor TFIIS